MSKLHVLVLSFFIAGVYFLIALFFQIAITRNDESPEITVSAVGSITYSQGIPYVV